MAAARQDAFKAQVRALNAQVWNGIRDLQALQGESNALDYGTTLETTDGEPTAGELLAVVFATADALRTVLNAGHATNMAKLL
jgi:hypothetical protein